MTNSQFSHRNEYSRRNVNLTWIQRKVLKAALPCGVKGLRLLSSFMFLTLEELGSAENHTEMPACQTKQKREDRCSDDTHDPGAARWSPDVLRLVAEARHKLIHPALRINLQVVSEFGHTLLSLKVAQDPGDTTIA